MFWCIVVLAAGCAGGAKEETSTTEQAVSTTCIELHAVADAMVSNPPMTKNFGGLPILRVGVKDESLVRFDLGSVPAGAVIDNATLKLYVSGSESNSPVNVHRVVAPWAEASVTYASLAQHFDPDVVGSIAVTSHNVQKAVDLTSLAISWLTGSPNHGILLETSDSKKTIFVSREGGTATQRPALQVCYSVPVDHCAPNPCENGAACENTANGFECHCTPGYTGVTCGELFDNCASQPCLNGGTCANGVNGYTCTCVSGFAGDNCEINVDECAQAPCENGAVCEDGVAGFTCHCAPGYEGVTCGTVIDNCAAAPCHNGGACTNLVGGYACTCAPGFQGTNCEIDIDDCAGNPCHFGGTCIDGVSSFTCSCPPDRGGATCDINLNTCAQNPCLNGSTCTNGYGNYTCTCAAGYSGTNCEIDINDCTPTSCLNDGVCTDGVDSYTCACPPSFTGASCEIPVVEVVGTNNDGVVGFAYTNTFSITGGTAPLGVELTAGSLPPGLSFFSAGPRAAIVTGTPTAPGTFHFTITATDTFGVRGSNSFTIVVVLPQIDVVGTDIGATVGTRVQNTYSVVGGVEPFGVAVTAGQLPPGVNFFSGGGRLGILDGTPTAAGTFQFTITFTDKYGSPGMGVFNVVVVRPTIDVSGVDTDGIVGVPFSSPFTVSGGIAPYLHTVAGTLPPGLSFGATGASSSVLEGTPTAPGTFTYTVTGTDKFGSPGSRSFTTIIVPPHIDITAADKPGTVGVRYTNTYSVSGGSAPYGVAVTAGTVPPGLSFFATSSTSGALDGTPTAAGTFNFTITATDKYGSQGSRSFTVSIGP